MGKQAQLIDFLQRDLAVSSEAIALAQRQAESMPNLLPVVLWQYGILTTRQLEQTFAWLENRHIQG